MKFKTRLKFTFVIIIILPLLLTVIAFMSISFMMTGWQGNELLKGKIDFMTDDSKKLTYIADELYDSLLETMDDDPHRLEDVGYLEELSENINSKSLYIVVRKDNDLFYSGDVRSATAIFNELPAYGNAPKADGAGYYFNDIGRYIRQIDFEFSDGGEGSLFVVFKPTYLISRKLLLYMFIAIFVILIFTSVMLTASIRKSVFLPVSELNTAMQKIKEGDFDYVLETDNQGEIGELYRNYEDMRMRLKESTAEKIEQDKQSKELIRNISHDLKTPITAIKGYVEGIMDGVADTPEKVDKYVKTIYNKANDMDKLINELTLYSGIDSNRIPYNFHRINVSAYFGDCVEEVGLDLEQRNIELNYSNLISDDTIVIADPEQIKKVINNIISNSIKYMDKQKGRIDIRILDEIDSFRVEIEDNGKGIAQKDLQKIFDRFYRTDASRNSAQGGSGIGLSIVKKIIEDHGGYIWATSKEGEGTCIHFVLRKYIELPQNGGKYE